MAYWLMKSEPFKYSWDNLVRDGVTTWDGVRNHVAKANLLAMRVGDEALFYHSNEGKACMGVVRVVKEAEPDVMVEDEELTKDGRNPWVVVTVAPVCPLRRPVTLAMVKAEPRLATMALVTQMRLSVQPVTAAEWAVVMELGT